MPAAQGQDVFQFRRPCRGRTMSLETAVRGRRWACLRLIPGNPPGLWANLGWIHVPTRIPADPGRTFAFGRPAVYEIGVLEFAMTWAGTREIPIIEDTQEEEKS